MASVTKKRSATSQGGPKQKKKHLEPIGTDDKKKHTIQKLQPKQPYRARPTPKPKSHNDSTDKGKKRSLPVTQPLKDEDDNSSDESHDGDDDDGDVDDEQVEDGEQMDLGDEETMAVDSPLGPAKDPNASRESHKVQKALLEQRRAAKPHSDLLTEAKKAWRLAHQKNLARAEREKYIDALMKVIRGNVKDIVLKHDASRIVQTVVKYGREKERNEVAVELKGRYKDLVQNKYSKFLVTKLIRFCPAHREEILQEFQGHVLRLLLHREASSVLADTYELYANAYQRSLLLRDFYGKEASLFTLTSGSEADKEMLKKGLEGLLKDVQEERRTRILSALKENLVTIFNNPDKGAVSHAIVHRALWEYLNCIADSEQLRREIFESCQDVLAEMVHTKDGSRTVREFIARGTAKDRKQIVKALKPHIERMCKDDEAQLVLFTALDAIDDTKLTTKSIVSDIAASAPTLYTTPQGRRSLIYLLASRTRRHFTPAQISTLSSTDSLRAQTSKKDANLRTEEIRRAASESLLAWVAKSGADVSREPGGSLVVCEIMLFAEGDKSAASDTLLQALAKPYPSDGVDPHPISLSHTSRMYKTLLYGGHWSRAQDKIEVSPFWSPANFAKQFVQIVGRDLTLAMVRGAGDGIFIVTALCETLAKSTEIGEDDPHRIAVKSWFDKTIIQEITEDARKGSSLLVDSIRVV